MRVPRIYSHTYTYFFWKGRRKLPMHVCVCCAHQKIFNFYFAVGAPLPPFARSGGRFVFSERPERFLLSDGIMERGKGGDMSSSSTPPFYLYSLSLLLVENFYLLHLRLFRSHCFTAFRTILSFPSLSLLLSLSTSLPLCVSFSL